MNLKSNIFFVWICIGMFELISCASKPKIKGNGDLCGFVIDEENLPLENYIISARSSTGLWKHTATNKQGMFVFSDAAFGDYTFKGEKSCYVNLEEKHYWFHDRTKIFCFQINSIDKALTNVEQMILCEEYDDALELLNEINVERKTSAKKVVSIYRTYIKEQIKKKKEKCKNEK